MTTPTTTPRPVSADDDAPLTGLVAILRGVTPAEVLDLAETLAQEGFAGVEVPLNSPDPLQSVELLAREFGDDLVIGAGTVLDPAAAVAAADAGARIILAPDANPAVIETAAARGVLACPGVATPTEAFAALRAGAGALKIFPAGLIGIAGMRAWHCLRTSPWSPSAASTPRPPGGGVRPAPAPRASAPSSTVPATTSPPSVPVPARSFVRGTAQPDRPEVPP